MAYSQAVATAICEQLADGKGLRTICQQDGMPDKSTVLRWLENQPEFRDQYARAREIQADTLFDEILEIADDARNDAMKGRNGEDGVNNEHIQRSRLRVDARKWMAGKLRPKVYGEKLELSGDPEHPVVAVVERRIVRAKPVTD